jgi:hypothetical protein
MYGPDLVDVMSGEADAGNGLAVPHLVSGRAGLPAYDQVLHGTRQRQGVLSINHSALWRRDPSLELRDSPHTARLPVVLDNGVAGSLRCIRQVLTPYTATAGGETIHQQSINHSAQGPRLFTDVETCLWHVGFLIVICLGYSDV